jgi:hypothetical protein
MPTRFAESDGGQGIERRSRSSGFQRYIVDREKRAVCIDRSYHDPTGPIIPGTKHAGTDLDHLVE